MAEIDRKAIVGELLVVLFVSIMYIHNFFRFRDGRMAEGWGTKVFGPKVKGVAPEISFEVAAIAGLQAKLKNCR